MANISKMNKAKLIEHGKKLGIKLDNGMTKKTMVELIKKGKPTKAKATTKPKPKQKSMAKPRAKKAKQKAKSSAIIGKPVKQKPFVAETKTTAPAKEKTIWETIKDFFGV